MAFNGEVPYSRQATTVIERGWRVENCETAENVGNPQCRADAIVWRSAVPERYRRHDKEER